MTGEKTEEATPRQRQRARERGQVAQSKELGQSVAMLVSFCVLYLLMQLWGRGFLNMLHDGWSDVRPVEFDQSFYQSWVLYSMQKISYFVLPIALASTFMIIASSVMQTKGVLSAHPLSPKLDRLNPINGFKKMFSTRGLVELIKAILKIGIVSAIIFYFIKSRMDIIVQGFFGEPITLISVFGRQAFQLAIYICAFFIILSVIDFIYQKWESEKSLKMSKQEVKEEFKQMEGDPLIKRRIRERQRQIAMTRMAQAIPESDVVITNPTHFAVALKYEDDLPAPQVIAKGKGDIALRIIQIAKEFNIPIEQNPPLAQSLYRLTEVGEMIPFELYEALAEILAKIYRKKRKKIGVR
ncbi:flagellar biosynthesis protein FlhB [bacterium]|nr:flagellar biosynthesis protein FlhB [bacterium]MBU1026068.1 flagellar biosynthesis protein FlhB [bacterium]